MTNYQQWTTTALILLVLANDTEAYSRDDSFIGYSETIISHPRVAAQGQEYLIFATAYGDITVRLLIHEAPQTVNHMKHLVEKGLFEGCAFYRVEPATETHDTGYTGSRKGYALIQGGLHSCGKQFAETLPIEAEMANRKGTVSLITGTSEFFFNLEDHLEWNGSFTAWGEVADERSWQVLNTLVSLPTRQEKHPVGTVMRILLKEVVFSVSLRKG
eukprot:c23039_g1_i2 orf=513-1160(-)